MRTTKQIQEDISHAIRIVEEQEKLLSALRREHIATLEYEGIMKIIWEWEKERVLEHRMQNGAKAVLRATWWTPTPGGRIRKCFIGAGLRHDRVRSDLLSVFEVTDYRGRSMHLLHGLCPPLEIVLDIQRIYEVRKET